MLDISFGFFFSRQQCVLHSCRSILLDVNITKCGQLVILHKNTLHRIENGMPNGTDVAAHDKVKPTFSQINTLKLDELKSLNIAKNHPLW